jgi:hypothetical protein
MAMKPKLVALNAGLALGLVLIVWQGSAKWEEAQAERHASINVPVRHVTPPPMVPAQKPEAVQSAKYVDVATKNLFSKDRNPNVVIDPPKPEDVKVMPPLPVVYGAYVLSSVPKAIMAEHSGSPTKSVRAGDQIGEFKILALDLRKVKLEWNGKEIDRDLDDLADRSSGAAARVASANAPSGPAVAAAPANKPATSAALGAETGTPDAPSRTCTAGDTSAVGAVVDGYKKTGTATPFGVMNCSWVPNK